MLNGELLANGLFGFAIAFALSLVCTLIFRRVLLARKIMDVPNERSSHETPVARGGGAVFVALAVVCLALGAGADFPLPGMIAAAVATAMVAIIGMIDDARGVPAAVRLMVHLGAAACIVTGVQVTQDIGVGVGLTILTAWLINAVNFMDGADGMAGAEGVFVLAAAALLGTCGAGDATAAPAGTSGTTQFGPQCPAILALVLAGLVGGFLAVNLSRARVFMGDVGSGALGCMLAWVLIAFVATDRLTIWAALILPAMFLADATVTLAIRVLRGQNPVRAHRTHAYQRLIRRGWSHAQATGAYAAPNLLVVAPAAYAASKFPHHGAWIAAAVYGIFSTFAAVLGAGREPAQSSP